MRAHARPMSKLLFGLGPDPGAVHRHRGGRGRRHLLLHRRRAEPGDPGDGAGAAGGDPGPASPARRRAMRPDAPGAAARLGDRREAQDPYRRVRRQLRRRRLGRALQHPARRQTASRSTNFPSARPASPAIAASTCSTTSAPSSTASRSTSPSSPSAPTTPRASSSTATATPFMSEGWQRIVTERVTAVVNLLRERGIQVYWVGLPKMREAAVRRRHPRDERLLRLAHAGARRPLFRDGDAERRSGRPVLRPISPIRARNARFNARTNDGIHMTIPGYIIVMRPLTERIRRSVAQARAAGGRRAPSARRPPPPRTAPGARAGRAS